MPITTLPSGREVDLDPNPTGLTEGRPSNIPGTRPPGWTDADGAAPLIPDYIASAWQALGGNMEMLPAVFSMGNAYNLFNYDQRMGQVQGTPGFGGVLSNLSGTLPQDVINQLAQRSAERGIGHGIPDSPNADAAYLRALGLTSLDLQNRGQQQLGSLLGAFPQAAPFDIMRFLVTPEDQQAANAAANVSAAAPNPRAAADEEQRKLLEAIAAGKAAAGAGGPVGSGGVDYSKIIDLIKSLGGGTDKGPGTVVGTGPRNTIDRGYSPPPIYPSYTPTTYKDPGSSGYSASGIRSDAVKNASDYVNQIFKTPDYSNAATRGGLGMDPVLNAIVMGMGNTGSTGGPALNPNGTYFSGGYSDFGAPITSQGINYGQSGAYDMFSTSPGDSYFGMPITSHDLYSGSPDSDWLNAIFDTPSYSDYGSLGGMGLDPTLNAILGGGGLYDSSAFGTLTPNDYSQFGQPLFPDTGGSWFDDLIGGSSSSWESDITDWLGFD